MYLLCKRIVNLHLPVECQLFDQTTVPILLYGSDISGFESLEMLEKIILNLWKSFFKDGLPYLLHSFGNKHFNKISLGNMLYLQNKL